MRLLASRPDAAATVARARNAARARRAVVASMDPMQRAARHAMRMAGTTALQDLLAEVAGRRREAHDTAVRKSESCWLVLCVVWLKRREERGIEKFPATVRKSES